MHISKWYFFVAINMFSFRFLKLENCEARLQRCAPSALLFVQFFKDNSGSDFLLGKEHLFPANFSKISHKESK